MALPANAPGDPTSDGRSPATFSRKGRRTLLCQDPLAQLAAQHLVHGAAGQGLQQHHPFRQLEHRHFLAAQPGADVCEAGLAPLDRAGGQAHPLSQDLVGHADHGGLAQVRVRRQQVVELGRRNVDAAADDQLLAAADEAIEPRQRPRPGDLEQIAGAEEAVGVEGALVQLRRAEVAAEHRWTLDAQLAGPAGLGDLAPVDQVDQPGADQSGRGGGPLDAVHAETREEVGAVCGVGRLGLAGIERAALVGAEKVADLDAEIVLEALDHPGRQRRRARADRAHRAQVGGRAQRRGLQQGREDRGRGDGVVHPLLRDLGEEHRQVERVVQHQGAAAPQPRHHQPADRADIHQRKWVQHHLAVAQAGRLGDHLGGDDPVGVVARHALRPRFGARGPADGGHLSRLDRMSRVLRRRQRRVGGANDGVQVDRSRWRRAA